MKTQLNSLGPITALRMYSLVLAVAGMLAVSPVMAAKPDSAGGGNSGKSEQTDKGKHQSDSKSGHSDKRSDGAKASLHFDDRHRTVIRDYYKKEFGRGSCPPGLAKKNNGCLPPGQAKKWTMGRPLRRDVIFYDLPGSLLRELGAAPEGHKYVRVAADILLIAVGTGLVVDAIADLNSL
ncbi:MAG: hypothetical protein ACRESV_00605 [Nevskiales bacterium]